MYLTRVQVDLQVALHAGLTDAYAWHQGFWKAFPGRDGERRDFLCRVDEKEPRENRGRILEALVLSLQTPAATPWGRWQTLKLASTFLGHERYAFALRANPTVKRVVRDAAGVRRKNGRVTRILRRQTTVAGGRQGVAMPGLGGRQSVAAERRLAPAWTAVFGST
ncbi:MAG: type I-E CRISPR-associated protein Cas6/Cse3/CasE, partial [Candidatus Latescibacterota bacterium]